MNTVCGVPFQEMKKHEEEMTASFIGGDEKIIDAGELLDDMVVDVSFTVAVMSNTAGSVVTQLRTMGLHSVMIFKNKWQNNTRTCKVLCCSSY